MLHLKTVNSVSCKGGYALLDVLMALFLFSISFAVLFGLTETTNIENQQSANLTQAMNIAQKSIERLAGRSWAENIANRECIPGGAVVGSEGLFDWTLYAEWDVFPELLEIQTEVKWLEKGKIRSYRLGSLYHVD
ncbi:MAG: type IV pilus modification PilV family protein [Desulfitobacteriaceae bacterium]